jgi:hypothetical protein
MQSLRDEFDYYSSQRRTAIDQGNLADEALADELIDNVLDRHLATRR